LRTNEDEPSGRAWTDGVLRRILGKGVDFDDKRSITRRRDAGPHRDQLTGLNTVGEVGLLGPRRDERRTRSARRGNERDRV
jgi:hypothetical protein